MRRLVLLSFVLALAGCAESDLSFPSMGGAPDSAPASASPTEINYRNAMATERGQSDSCTRVASERSHDADLQGFDGDVHQRVYDKTFADCMEWAARKGR